MYSELEKLEQESIYVLQEAKAQFNNIAVLWSTGKDSTALLWIIRKCFFGNIPWPVIHIDTGYKFPQMYEFRDKLAKKWKLRLIVARNEKAITSGVSPEKDGRLKCCTLLKTEALKQIIKQHGFDAIVAAIRSDEHGIRAKERYFSPRDSNFRWNYKKQVTEMWDIFIRPADDLSHVRVHPLLHWTELDVWNYIKQEGIPVNPLYFAKNGKRYRSLGCMPCTNPIQSNADTIDKIIAELRTTKTAERAGRAQDKEAAHMMEKLRALGYM